MRAWYSSQYPTCEHSESDNSLDYTNDSIWTFDELLGGWSPYEPDEDEKTIITAPMNTVKKLNLAIGLSPQNAESYSRSALASR